MANKLPNEVPREVPKLIQRLRHFLLGGLYTTSLRYVPHNVMRRRHPLPNLPEGPSHKLENNYYYCENGRDARGEVSWPEVVKENRQIPEGGPMLKSDTRSETDTCPGDSGEVQTDKTNRAPERVPGKVYHWDKLTK